jgi:hypothetical protein
MAKKSFNFNSPIKPISTGAVPTTTTLKKGEWAYGVIGGVNRFFGNPTGDAIVEFSPLNAIKGVSYNSTTAVLTFTPISGTATTISLPKENFLSAASYSPTTKKLSLTLTDNSVVEVSLSELIDSYIAATDGGLEVVNNNQFKIKAAGVAEAMLASAVATKLNKVLSVSGGTAETGKYISGISVSDHAITVTKTALPVSAADITSLQTAINNVADDVIYSRGIYNLNIMLGSNPYSDRASAYTDVPVEERKPGLLITFLTANEGWITEQYIATDTSVNKWNNDANWIPINPNILATASNQTISISGYTDGVTATINASAAVTDGGLKVTNGALELDTDDIEIIMNVVSI